jgi:hypothetical protein
VGEEPDYECTAATWNNINLGVIEGHGSNRWSHNPYSRIGT